MDLDGNYISVFESAVAASKALGVGCGNISLCCRGLADRVKNYRFRYVDDVLNEKAVKIRQVRHNKASDNHKKAWIPKRRKVYQFSLDAVLIACYKNADIASSKNGIPKHLIFQCCNGTIIQSGGYIWSYNNKVESVLKNDIPTEQGEEWRDVVGYEGLYMVSSFGRVWSLRRRTEKVGNLIGGFMLTNHIDNRGRTSNTLTTKNGEKVNAVTARLVVMSFIPNPDNLPQVNHKDENPLNNHVDNLEWCTAKYNCNYGTRIERIKEKQNIPILQYTLNGEFVAEYASMHIAADAINADAGHICDCCLGNRSYAYGFFWRYKDDEMYNSAKVRLQDKISASKKSRADKFTARALNVVQLDMNGKYIQTHQSSRLAAERVGSFRPMIINCCNGKISNVKGYKFMYERDFRKMFIETENESQQLSLF